MDVSKSRRSVGAGAFASAALMVATACNAGVDAGPPAGVVQAPRPAPAPGLRTVDNARLGKLVTDEKGWVLYRFEKDSPNPPASNCTGGCASRWQPAAAVSDTQVRGVDQNLVGSVTRPDGTPQLTLGGMPLYRFTGDENPGDTKGQGADRSWYAATPDGAKAGAPARREGGSGGNGPEGY
ncbi:hypothetical protein PV703_17480 [Streptomyces sp. ME01-24h]|nr:hypothetical protein [Streptomyces sp. ME19-03-3]MDX3355066.1 hypothetical protein [Streptomyces sp. ME01-24h]